MESASTDTPDVICLSDDKVVISSGSSDESSDSSGEYESDSEGEGRKEEVKSGCIMCSATPKYRCPGCARQTCSLPCTRGHKDKYGCTGSRDRTAYVGLDKYSTQHLKSDFVFLEEVDRKVNNLQRLSSQMKTSDWKRNRRNVLARAAKSHGVRYEVLPVVLARSKENISSYHKKSDRLTWFVKWIFPQADNTVFSDSVSDATTLEDALKKYIGGEQAEPTLRCRLTSYNQGSNGSLSSVQLFMPAENQPANANCFYRFELSSSLRCNLDGCVLYEYPTIHVVLASSDVKSHTPSTTDAAYNIVDKTPIVYTSHSTNSSGAVSSHAETTPTGNVTSACDPAMGVTVNCEEGNEQFGTRHDFNVDARAAAYGGYGPHAGNIPASFNAAGGYGHPGAPYHGAPYPGAQYPGTPYPAMPYPPGASYPGAPYPSGPYHGNAHPSGQYPPHRRGRGGRGGRGRGRGRGRGHHGYRGRGRGHSPV
eukprot:scpid63580/ scgid0894/ Box C/D snoRNA protein 1; Zinc finger HIT domain-containing protein 6